MKTIVLYQSKYGHTKQYAEMIASELKCHAMPFTKCRKKDIEHFDTIVFGTGVYMGKMKKLNKVKKLFLNKPLTIFACGGNNNDEKEIDKIKHYNLTEEELSFHHFFYLPGGLDVTITTWPTKMMFHIIEKMLDKKKEKTSQEIDFLKSIKHPKNYIDKKHISKLINSLNY